MRTELRYNDGAVFGLGLALCVLGVLIGAVTHHFIHSHNDVAATAQTGCEETNRQYVVTELHDGGVLYQSGTGWVTASKYRNVKEEVTLKCSFYRLSAVPEK